MKKLLTLLALAFCLNGKAQITTLLSFNVSDGQVPWGSLVSDGTYLYGMTYGGGSGLSPSCGSYGCGTIFRIKPDGSGDTVLFNFNFANGANPIGSLIYDGTFLYGMTWDGGSHGGGVIFKIKPNGTGFDTLGCFGNNGLFGYKPESDLYYDGTYLYGTTTSSNSYGGNIFKIKTDGTGFTNLHNFIYEDINGSFPVSSLISDGTYLYGTTLYGGASRNGTVYKIKPDGTSFAKIYDFADSTNGHNPGGSLLYDGAYLYGMTRIGGINNKGVLFKVKTDGTGFSKLIDFNGTSGYFPNFGSLISDGTFLYGMTMDGGSIGEGNIFKIKPDGSNYTDLYDFSGYPHGSQPYGSLYFYNNILYGMTNSGGALGSLSPWGTIFKFCIPVWSSSTSICLGDTATLIANASSISTYTWNTGVIGDTIKVSPSVTTIYTVSGTTGTCTSVATTTVTVFPLPTVSYTLTATSTPHYYDAVPAYSSNVSSARWYWGDGTSTVGLYPSHTYSVAGTYSICVTAYSSCGDSAVSCQNDAVSRLANNNSVFSNMVYINVVSSITTATASPSTICAGSTTTLTASGATTYSWSPGTGLSATTGSMVAASPTVTTTYTVVGTTGASTVSTAITVSVNPLPVVHFTANHPCLGTAVTITNTTPNQSSITNWSWNFGDGSTSTIASPPAHSYSAAGCYSVALTATNTNGCNGSFDTTIYVHANPEGTFDAWEACLGNTSDFMDGSYITNPSCLNDRITFWQWDFGDGTTISTYTTGTLPDTIKHTYAFCGAFNITLTVTTNNGCSSTVTLTGDTVFCLPVVSITPVKPSLCNGSITGINLYAHGAQTYTWTQSALASWPAYLDAKGDSVWVNPSSLSPPQAFTYSATGTDSKGCVATAADTIKVIACPPLYQKLLADSVTEFDIVSACLFTRLSNPNQTLSNCITLSGYGGGAPNQWYAKGDSLYGGKTYKKITNNNTFQGLMREDTITKKVYFIQYCNTYEELLYNFSLNQGDTVTYHFVYSSGLMTSGVFTLDSIRLKHDYKGYRNHFYLKNHSVIGNDVLEMIEGVGNVSHPLFLYYQFQQNAFNTAFSSCSGANFNMALSCKWDNGNKMYYDSCLYHEANIHGGLFGPDSCTYCWGATGGIEQYTSLEKVTISPNPTNGNFIIEPNSITKQTMQLYDVNGKLVLSQTINGKTNIDAGSLNEGVYNICIIGNEGIVNRKLVIVK